ncbi:hypothetical protein [Mycobacteroides abscessus]|nr:hypothetical protein [Mycobacteroides abscessus]EHM20068.1 hypothetical protein MMAS_13530 [Mycobacteroides abscessus subsp. massiliense CCUG 48898 = JCM 15300]MBL3749172.1 hypothetical protein [Mycobacteroides abscessus subsp. massiliense]BAP96221.1 hypothetical protein MMASJCM_1445 [Mycobacteroides abscessus subsp. massiliense CCUG 48898 = JCM 15300]
MTAMSALTDDLRTDLLRRWSEPHRRHRDAVRPLGGGARHDVAAELRRIA